MRGDWAKPNATMSQAPKTKAKITTSQTLQKDETTSKNVVVMTPAGYAAAYPEDSKKEDTQKEGEKKKEPVSEE